MITRVAAPAILVGAAAGLAFPESASAHALVGRQDLPIPEWLFAWGASLVLIVSFVALTLAWRRPFSRTRAGIRRPAGSHVSWSTRSPSSWPARSASFCSRRRSGPGFDGTGARPQLHPHLRLRHLWLGLVAVSVLFGDGSAPSTPGGRSRAPSVAAAECSRGSRRARRFAIPNGSGAGLQWPTRRLRVARARLWASASNRRPDPSHSGDRDPGLLGADVRLHRPFRGRELARRGETFRLHRDVLSPLARSRSAKAGSGYAARSPGSPPGLALRSVGCPDPGHDRRHSVRRRPGGSAGEAIATHLRVARGPRPRADGRATAHQHPHSRPDPRRRGGDHWSGLWGMHTCVARGRSSG